MRLCPLLALAILAWLAAAAPASAADRRKPCTSETAVAATIAEVQGDFERWYGRCVRLAGLLAERRLYADWVALAQPLHSDEPVTPRSIVVYPEGPGRVLPPGTAEVVGTIGSCEAHLAAATAAQAKEPESIIWASGYCHTSTETYIRPTSIARTSDLSIPRLMEWEIPPGERPLVEAPHDTPGLALHVATARAMAEALIRGDRSEFLRLADADATLALADLNGKPPPEWLRDSLRKIRKAFAAQAGRKGLFPRLAPLEARRQRVLVDRGDLEDGAIVRAFTCWCREPDCTGRWPVLPDDADNSERRPYACILTTPYRVHRRGDFMQADASRHPSPFAEPAFPRN